MTTRDKYADTSEDTLIDIAVLANDYDIIQGLDPTTVTLITEPKNGVAEVQPDGTIRYTPDLHFSGDDTFLYTVSDVDGISSPPARVNITVTAVPDPPILTVADVEQEEPGTPIPLNIASALVDEDESETLSILIEGLPEGATLSAGQVNVDGSYTLLSEELDGLSMIPPPVNAQNFTLTITATATESSNGESASTQATQLVVVNSPPVVEDQAFTVDENSANGTVVGTVAATDPDEGDTLTFAILGGTGAFAIDLDSGEITVADSAQLDYEVTQSFALDVQVTDSTGQSDTAIVTIDIGDVGELTKLLDRAEMVFGAMFYDRRGRVSKVNGQVVNISAEALNGPIYAVVESISDPNVTVRNADGLLDGKPYYDVTPHMTDGTLQPGESTSSWTFIFTNSRLARFDFVICFYGEGSAAYRPVVGDQVFTVDENSEDGTVVGTVTASDPDAGDSLTYAILGGTGAFSVDPDSGELSVLDAAQLDYESTQSFDLDVEVTDSGGLADSALVTVMLNDVAELTLLEEQARIVYSAMFHDRRGRVSKVNGHVESLSTETLTAPLYAVVNSISDPSVTLANGDSLLDGKPYFDVSPLMENGRLEPGTSTPSWALVFDNPRLARFDVEVVFYTMAFAPSPALLVANQAPLVADQAFGVAENSPVGTVIGTVAATDPDSSDTLTFGLADGTEWLAIDPHTGELTVADPVPLDFEAAESLAVSVEVTDPEGLSATAVATIGLPGVNEAPVVSDQTFSVNENSPSGTGVGSVAASDPDAGDTVTFSLVGGTGAFAIGADSGEIRVADGGQLDFETSPSFDLDVAVTDAAGLTSAAVATVELANRNEPPVVEDQGFTVAENSANGAVVGTVATSDPDAGDTVTFSLVGGTGAFAVNESGGVTVADASQLDFETTPSFSLDVDVTDRKA